MPDGLDEPGRCYGMENNMKQTKAMGISRQLSPVQIMIGQKQMENVEYLKHVGRMTTDNARYVCKIKCRISKTKSHSQRRFFPPDNWA
jgi:hypothetical protein